MAKKSQMGAQPDPLPDSTSERAANDPIIMARDTLTGDIRDFILDRLKNDHNPLPWNVRNEASQNETIGTVQRAVAALVSKVVDILAADGKPVLRGVLKKVLIKDVYACHVDFLKSDPLRHTLADSTGQVVMLSIAAPEEYDGERAPVPVSKDQSSLLNDHDD